MIGQADVGETIRTEMSRTVTRVPWVGPRVAVRLHRLGIGVATTTWEQLADRAELERPTVLSVDVFDTCVMRDLLGDRPIEMAIDRRIAALVESGGEAPGRGEIAAELELQLCRAVPDVGRSLARIRDAGVDIVFVSDTDRTSSTLERILQRAGIFVDGDRLIASCEAGSTKSDGALYRELWSNGDSHRGRVWHVGNNLWSDVTMAHQAGLRAHAMVECEPTRYESAMAARPASAGPALAAAARRARLAVDVEAKDDLTPEERRLEVLGTQVAGQAFGAFLLWVGEQARRESLGHLSFLSRDGEILLDMARAMPRDHWSGLSLGYIHCSRWSWVLAGAASYGLDRWLAAGTENEQAFIHANRHGTPLASLLGRIGLDQADIRGHRDIAALPATKPLPRSMAGQWEALLDDPAVTDLILARSIARRDLIIDYLRSIDLPPGPAGLVDVGWRGRQAWAMSPIVAEVTGHEPIHFHVGGDQILADVEAEIDIRRFAFDEERNPTPIENPVSCVETLTASGRARVVGYEPADDGTVQPIFEREVSEVRNPDQLRLRNGAVRTAANIPARADLADLGCTTESLAAEAVDVLSRWWTTPERVEVEAMRGLAFEADDDGRVIEPLVTPYSPREIAADEKRPRQWQQGSATVSTPPLGAALRVYRLLRSWARVRR